MRISDWSSDVCSSDLIVHGAANSAWIVLFLVQTSLIATGRPDMHRVMGIAGAGLGAIIIVLALVTAIAGGRLHHSPPGIDPRSFLAFPRSAEHTSELQSLMRISYAVFCLKKKQQI